MKKQLAGFMDFVRQNGVVGLAVGLAIGLQVGLTTNAIVDGFINPIVAFILSFVMNNPENLEKMTWTISQGEHPLVIGYGLIISFLIKLLAVAAVVYFIVHGLRLDRVDKKKEDKEEKPKNSGK